MSEGGLSADGGNGSHHWQVDRDAGYEDDRAELEGDHPRIDRVFRVLHRQLARLPYLNARWLAGEVWLYRTRSAVGAPSIFVWYEIREAERVVALLAATLAE